MLKNPLIKWIFFDIVDFKICYMLNCFLRGIKMNDKVKERNHLFDNVRALSMFLVVFGHLLECFYTASKTYKLYNMLYTFIVPLLVFLSGYFAKFDIKKIITKIIIPFAIFQFIYSFFLNYYSFRLVQPYTANEPYWLLWYLYSLAFWKCTVSVLQFIKPKWFKFAVVVVFVILGVMAGFDKDVNRQYSLSRSLVYFPFFAFGYFLKTSKFDFSTLRKNFTARVMIIVCAIVLLSLIFESNLFNRMLLYGASAYKNYMKDTVKGCHYRLLLYPFATIVIFGIFMIMPTKKIWPLSIISKHSMSVYLLHGFIVLIFKEFKFYPVSDECIKYAMFMALFICFSVAMFMWFKTKIVSYNKNALSYRMRKKKEFKNPIINWFLGK